jgi:DNA polymerase-3 subunit gamma/tau
MSYLVLARKARPQTFAQVIGQRPVVTTLRNSIIRNRVAHAILFSGVRGVGKTTLARIMAKAINCQAEPAERPCDQCPSCRQIATGSSLDLYEIDGASNRGIQEIRELKEKIRFLPTSSQYKIIIIDEVHMLTTEAFNALLKTLEEPPAHVYFMFATTEIHKIPITILSRCQQYELKRISAKELYDHFLQLVTDEGFEIDPPALSLIVREAGGSVRDGLSLLDQMFSYGEKKISNRDVVEVLGLVNREVLMRLTKALLDGNRSEAFLTLEEIFNFGMDLKRFVEDIMDHFRTLLLCKIEGCTQLIDLPGEELKDFQNLAAGYTSETLHLKLSLLMTMAEDLKFSPQPRLTLETSFLKIIEAANVTPVTALLGHLDKIIAALPTAPVPLQDILQAEAPVETKKKD